MQENVYPLIQQLCDGGYVVSVETGGSLPISKLDKRAHTILDIKCPASKMSHKNHWPNLPLLRAQDEVKFVIMGWDDYIWAKEICMQHDLYAKVLSVLFSPVFGQLDPQDLVAWILKDKLPVRLNLQMHKYIWTPTTRGV